MLLGTLARFGDDSTIFSSLGISGQAFLIQLVTFMIAFFVLRKWAFKPILRVLDERRQRIEDGLRLGEAMEAEKEKLDAAVTAELHKARIQADKIITSADAEAKQTLQSAEEAARKRADEIIAAAKDQIKHETNKERQRLEREVVQLVSELSEVVIQEKVDERKDAVLINKVLKEQSAA